MEPLPWGLSSLRVEGVALATTRVMPRLDRRTLPAFEAGLAKQLRVADPGPLARIERAGWLAALDRVPEALDDAQHALRAIPEHERARRGLASLAVAVLLARHGAPAAVDHARRASAALDGALALRAEHELAVCLRSAGQGLEALATAREAVRGLRARRGVELELVRALMTFAECQRDLGRFLDARAASLEAAELLEAIEHPHPAERRDLLFAIARDHVEVDRVVPSALLLRLSGADRDYVEAYGPAARLDSARLLHWLHHHGDYGPARPFRLQRALDALQLPADPGPALRLAGWTRDEWLDERIGVRVTMALRCRFEKQFDTARRHWRRALACAEQLDPAAPERVADLRRELAAALLDGRPTDEARREAHGLALVALQHYHERVQSAGGARGVGYRESALPRARGPRVDTADLESKIAHVLRLLDPREDVDVLTVLRDAERARGATPSDLPRLALALAEYVLAGCDQPARHDLAACIEQLRRWRASIVDSEAAAGVPGKAARLAIVLVEALTESEFDGNETLVVAVTDALEAPPIAPGPLVRLMPHVRRAAKRHGGWSLRRAARRYARAARWLFVRDSRSDVPAIGTG